MARIEKKKSVPNLYKDEKQSQSTIACQDVTLPQVKTISGSGVNTNQQVYDDKVQHPQSTISSCQHEFLASFLGSPIDSNRDFGTAGLVLDKPLATQDYSLELRYPEGLSGGELKDMLAALKNSFEVEHGDEQHGSLISQKRVKKDFGSESQFITDSYDHIFGNLEYITAHHAEVLYWFVESDWKIRINRAGKNFSDVPWAQPHTFDGVWIDPFSDLRTVAKSNLDHMRNLLNRVPGFQDNTSALALLVHEGRHLLDHHLSALGHPAVPGLFNKDNMFYIPLFSELRATISEVNGNLKIAKRLLQNYRWPRHWSAVENHRKRLKLNFHDVDRVYRHLQATTVHNAEQRSICDQEIAEIGNKVHAAFSASNLP